MNTQFVLFLGGPRDGHLVNLKLPLRPVFRVPQLGPTGEVTLTEYQLNHIAAVPPRRSTTPVYSLGFTPEEAASEFNRRKKDR
jgi:hypothetical protein